MRRELIALVGSLLVILIMVSACSSPGTTAKPPASLENIELIVERWVDKNVDDLSEVIGKLVTGDLPIARDIAAEAVKRAMRANLEWQIIEQETFQDKQERVARVRLMFPLKLELTIISRQYQISVDYILRLLENRVVNADIDLDSFQK